MPGFTIRRLTADDAQAYRALRLLSLQIAPNSFGADPVAEAALPIEVFVERLAASAVFGVLVEEHLVGMAGFRQEERPNERHKGVLRGVFVHPDWQGRGLAGAVITRVLEHAAEHVEQLILTAVEGNAPAITLYQRLGFEIYGVEPRARKTASGYLGKVLMARSLASVPGCP